MISFCEERGMRVSSTLFEHKIVHKYTRAGAGRDGNEMKSMAKNGVLIKREIKYVMNIKTVRKLRMGI